MYKLVLLSVLGLSIAACSHTPKSSAPDDSAIALQYEEMQARRKAVALSAVKELDLNLEIEYTCLKYMTNAEIEIPSTLCFDLANQVIKELETPVIKTVVREVK